MTLRAILFDADGVLVDSRTVACEAFNELRTGVASSLPVFEGQTQLAQVFSGPLRESLIPFGLSESDARKFFSTHANSMRLRRSHLRPFDRVLAAVCRISLPKAVVSSSFEETLHSVFAQCTDYTPSCFFKVIGRDSPGTKAAKICTVLADLKIQPHEAIYVGDMASDVDQARRAGVIAGVVSYGYHPHSHLMKCQPDLAFTTEDEFIAFLENPDGWCHLPSP